MNSILWIASRIRVPLSDNHLLKGSFLCISASDSVLGVNRYRPITLCINAYMWYMVTASRIICLSVVFLVYTFRILSSLLAAFLDNGSHLTCLIWYKHNGFTKGCPLYIHTDCDFSILSCSTSSPSNHRTTSLWWYMYTVSSYTRWNTFLLLFVLSARVFNSHHRKNEQI